MTRATSDIDWDITVQGVATSAVIHYDTDMEGIKVQSVELFGATINADDLPIMLLAKAENEVHEFLEGSVADDFYERRRQEEIDS